jgi:hypothetical protein
MHSMRIYLFLAVKMAIVRTVMVEKLKKYQD